MNKTITRRKQGEQDEQQRNLHETRNAQDYSRRKQEATIRGDNTTRRHRKNIITKHKTKEEETTRTHNE